MSKKPGSISSVLEFLGVWIIATGISAKAYGLTHIVQKGEALSKLAQKFIPGRVYGPTGSLKKIVALNPHLKNPNVILPGQEVFLGIPDEIQNREEKNLSMEPTKDPEISEQAVLAPVAIEKPPVAKNTPPQKEFWLWFGLGGNFQYYKQTIPSVAGEAIFQNIQGPTVVVSGGFQGPNMGLDFAFKDTPGEMASSQDLSVTNGSYHWQTISAEGLYPVYDDTNLRFGFQHHRMPFMVLNAATSIVDVENNNLTMLTAGFDRDYWWSKNLRGEWMMRYQQPLLSGSSGGALFKVTPKFAFDGSVGGVYSFSGATRLGVYWYGQWHEYSFKYKNGTTEFSGQQTLFYSNIELRMGLEF
jgi:LysM repeat protein